MTTLSWKILVIKLLSYRYFLRMDEFEVHRQEMTRIDAHRPFLLRLAELDNNAKTNDGEAKNLLGILKGHAP